MTTDEQKAIESEIYAFVGQEVYPLPHPQRMI